MAATSSSLSLCANMTSSIKPEVHQIVTLPEEDRATAIINMHKNGEDRTCSAEDNNYDRGQTNTHTHAHTHTYIHCTNTHADTVITILSCPIGGGVNWLCCRCSDNVVSARSDEVSTQQQVHPRLVVLWRRQRLRRQLRRKHRHVPSVRCSLNINHN